MVSEALIQAGARWVDGPSARSTSETWFDGWTGADLFTIAIQPFPAVVSTLYSEDGWWKPVSSIIDMAAGREILVGPDEHALVAALGAIDSTTAISLMRDGKRKKLERLIGEHPENTHLRAQTYRQLAARSRFETMEKIADDAIENGSPVADDWRAWAAARHQLAEPGDDAEPDISRLRDAIATHPDDPSLYLLLGAAYERSDRDARLDAARACYLKVLELTGWGAVAEDARAALDRLDSESVDN
jgi:hypothetical protein